MLPTWLIVAICVAILYYYVVTKINSHININMQFIYVVDDTSKNRNAPLTTVTAIIDVSPNDIKRIQHVKYQLIYATHHV